MAWSLHQLQTGIREGQRQSAGGADGNHGVLWVSEQEHRRPDRRDGEHQLVQLAQQGSLLCQEGAPQRAVLAARMSPDVPVDMLARAKRATAPSTVSEAVRSSSCRKQSRLATRKRDVGALTTRSGALRP